jgi:hypothetical protein
MIFVYNTTKKISLETLNLLVSNGIIFVLYNLYFISQIDNLEIRVGPLNRNGGSIIYLLNLLICSISMQICV